MTKKHIISLDRVVRLKLINSICGIRSVHLIGTRSKSNITNLAIFSSVTHLGSSPPLLGLVSRPDNKVKRHTLSNIKELGFFTINSVEKNMIERAHQTSGKYSNGVSEFFSCGFDEEYVKRFPAPFVSESEIKIGMKFSDSYEIKQNNTFFVVAEILLIKSKNKKINYNKGVGVVGLNSYFENKKIKDLKYVRIIENNYGSSN